MATATKPNGSQAQQQQQRPASETPLVDQILASMSPSGRAKEVRDALTHRSVIERVQGVLPDSLKAEAERFVRRAAGTFQRSKSLNDCPVAEFGRCVIEAAELGLAIDGNLCYVVRYKLAWQVIVDYKGLIAVAKRTGAIVECYTGIVRENDVFECGRDGTKSYLRHQFGMLDRGEMVGAYAGFVLPNGGYDFCYVDMADIQKFRAASAAKNGPWATWGDEMAKKSAVRRGLKLHIEDPGMLDAMTREDDYDSETQPGTSPPAIVPGRQSLRPQRTAPPAQIRDQAEEDAVVDESTPEKQISESTDPPPAANGATLRTLKSQIKELGLTDTQVIANMVHLNLRHVDSDDSVDKTIVSLSQPDADRLIDELAKLS